MFLKLHRYGRLHIFLVASLKKIVKYTFWKKFTVYIKNLALFYVFIIMRNNRYTYTIIENIYYINYYYKT